MTFHEFVDLCRICICLVPDGYGGYEYHKMLVDDDAQDDDLSVFDDTTNIEFDKDCEITVKDNVVTVFQVVARQYVFVKPVTIPNT